MGVDFKTGHGKKDCQHCAYIGKYNEKKDMYACSKQAPRDTRPEWYCGQFEEARR